MPSKPGDSARGDRYGGIEVRIAMDVYLPLSAELRVEARDVARGGESVIAVLH